MQLTYCGHEQNISTLHKNGTFQVDQYDKYRANAADAQREANRTTNLEDKASWLRLVQG